MLHVHTGRRVSETARLICAARSTVQGWREWHLAIRRGRWVPAARGRECWTVTDEVVNQINEWLNASPSEFGYLRTDWTAQLLALAVARQFNRTIHSSTLRRLLPHLGFVWRRTRPVRVRPDRGKNRKMRAIRRALRRRQHHETFYFDEADIDFNRRIDACWTRRGQPFGVPTPGHNHKHYVAGALHAHTGKRVGGEHSRQFHHPQERKGPALVERGSEVPPLLSAHLLTVGQSD